MPIRDELRNHIRSVYVPDAGLDEITDDLDVLDTGVIDSLGVLRLMAWLDRHFDIALSDADISLDDFRSISSIAALVEREQSTRRVS